MKQNTFWLVAGLTLTIGVGGFFTISAENKLPGLILIAVVSIAQVVMYKESVKQ